MPMTGGDEKQGTGKRAGSVMLRAAAVLLAASVAAVALIIHRGLMSMSGMEFVTKKLTDDDGRSLELSRKKVVLRDGNGGIIWKTEKGYRVQDMLLSDLDRDGKSELILLLWKRGRYGKHRPFWIDSDEKSYSQHIFIYSMEEELPKPLWFASDTGRIIRRMRLLDKDKPILLTEDENGRCDLWNWRSFGLKNLDNTVSFIAFGDNLIHESILEYGLYKNYGDFGFLYEDFAEEISRADIASLQQESILVRDRRLTGGYPDFGTPIEVGEAVADAGFDVVSCAGNHALDRGMTGIDDTYGFYESKGLICLGIQPSSDTGYIPYRVISKNGIRFALFDHTYGTGEYDVSDRYPFAVHYLPDNDKERSTLAADIARARTDADIIVFFVHWGKEREKEPDEEQREMATFLSECGVDVVIGTHPHVIQDPEVIRQEDGRETIVCYSLGNFRADQRWEDTRTGGELVFHAAHTWDGIRITDWQLKTIDSRALR